MATMFLKLAKRQKTQSTKIEMFEGEKVLSHKIICILS